ncbi:MAG: DUF3667 domain-containing protein [Gammaproteobacteria bacterium]|nr:DUF3667 domain-containing protein [Gammaproteobacteria bacterium]MDH3766813.1 DUF3667 domain-containing protein [Gammaproteobacteria bacterium]
MDPTPCKNCGEECAGKFCRACGQPRAQRLTFGHLLGSALGSLIDVDRGFLHTFLRLSTKPGSVPRDYVDGRQLPYTHPVKYCFIAVTAYALAINLLEISIELPGTPARTALEQQLFQIIHGLLAYLLFLTLYVVALLQTRLFRASGRSTAESYVFCLYAFGHVTWLSFLFAVTRWVETMTGVGILITLQWFYTLWALYGFYGTTRPPVLRSLLLLFVNALILNTASMVLASLIVQLGLVDFLSRLLVSGLKPPITL